MDIRNRPRIPVPDEVQAFDGDGRECDENDEYSYKDDDKNNKLFETNTPKDLFIFSYLG